VAETENRKKARKTTVSERAMRRAAGRHERKRGKRIPDAELLLRMRYVEQALIDGKRGQGVVDFLKEKKINVKYGTVVSYMQRVRDRWEEDDALLRPIWRERQLRKLHDVAYELESMKEWKYWIQVQKLIAHIEGNLAPTQHKVETKTDAFEDWTLQELRDFVDTKGEAMPERALQEGTFVGFTSQDRN